MILVLIFFSPDLERDHGEIMKPWNHSVVGLKYTIIAHAGIKRKAWNCVVCLYVTLCTTCHIYLWYAASSSQGRDVFVGRLYQLISALSDSSVSIQYRLILITCRESGAPLLSNRQFIFVQQLENTVDKQKGYLCCVALIKGAFSSKRGAVYSYCIRANIFKS